jgi:hypothetical protein
MVVSKSSQVDYRKATGLAVYFPWQSCSDEIDVPAYLQGDLGKSAWGRFIQGFAKKAPPRPNVHLTQYGQAAKLSITLGSGSPLDVNATCETDPKGTFIHTSDWKTGVYLQPNKDAKIASSYVVTFISAKNDDGSVQFRFFPGDAENTATTPLIPQDTTYEVGVRVAGRVEGTVKKDGSADTMNAKVSFSCDTFQTYQCKDDDVPPWTASE